MLTRRHVLAGAAATAAVAAMPVAAIAAVEKAPFVPRPKAIFKFTTPERMAGWAFIVNETTRPLLARLPCDTYADADRSQYSDAMNELMPALLQATFEASKIAGPHRWVAVCFSSDNRRMSAGAETWSYRQALNDAGYPVEPL